MTSDKRRTESAMAMAPSSATPTRARKSVSMRCRKFSLAAARMTGSETFHTTRERGLMLMRLRTLWNFFGTGERNPGVNP
jgi:hypothetical protein